MLTKPVALIVDVPVDCGDETARWLAEALAKELQRQWLRWPVVVGSAEGLASLAEPTTMLCVMWKHCKKHPAYGIEGLTAAHANCPHFVVGGVLQEGRKHSIPDPSFRAPSHAVVQGGTCICAAYERVDSGGDTQDHG
jgi:hypothetical protein